MTDDEIDTLAREMYSAALIVDGFSEESADRMASRQCPDSYCYAAEDMLAHLSKETS